MYSISNRLIRLRETDDHLLLECWDIEKKELIVGTTIEGIPEAECLFETDKIIFCYNGNKCEWHIYDLNTFQVLEKIPCVGFIFAWTLWKDILIIYLMGRRHFFLWNIKEKKLEKQLSPFPLLEPISCLENGWLIGEGNAYDESDGGVFNVIQIWNLETGKYEMRFRIDHGENIKFLEFPKNQYVVARIENYSDNPHYVLDIKNKKKLDKWKWEDIYVYEQDKTIEFLKMKDYIITGKGYILQIRDINFINFIHTKEFEKGLTAVTAIGDSYLAISFDDGEIQFWG